MKKLTNKLIILLTITFALCMFFAISFALKPVAAENLFKATYEIGETVKIPSKSIDVGGKTVQASAVVLLPDGSAVSKNSIVLDSYGKYTVEYRAIDDGKIYKDIHEFSVNVPLTSSASQSDSAVYGAATGFADDLRGLKIRVADGSTMSMNKVVDLSTLDENKPLISFYPLPETNGARDCSNLYLRVEDALNPNSYFIVRIKSSPTSKSNVYIMAKAHNQSKYAGVERGKVDGKPFTDGNYGFAASGSFYGNGIGSPSSKISIYYDNATQTIYSDNNVYGSSAGRYVIDFNNPKCFPEGFAGIESGIAKVFIYGGGYAKTSMGVIITQFADADLTKDSVVIDKASNVVVDYGDYDENSYPNAVVGSAYKIFDATSQEVYTKERVITNVFTSYYSSHKANLAIEDGCFIPKQAVTHYIEYKSIDGFGNENVKVIPITVIPAKTPITMSFSVSSLSYDVGSVITLPKPVISGGEGLVKYTVALVDKEDNSEEIIFESDASKSEVKSYRLLTAGEQQLKYVAKDYNGQTIEKNIDLLVNESTKPIISQVPVLAKYYVKNAKYSVPTIGAEDFSSGSLKEIDTTYKVKIGGEEVDCANGVFTVSGDGQVVFEYTAVDAQNRVNTVSYSVPIIDVGFNDNLDMSKYFVVDKGVADVGAESTLLVANSSGAKFEFIRELIGTAFEMEMNIPKDKNNYDSFSICLTDYEQSDKQVKLTFKNDKGNTLLCVNGGRDVEIGRSFGGAQQNIQIALTSNELNVGSANVIVNADLAGKVFDGFKGFVYLNVEFGKVSGQAGLTIFTLNRHPMINETIDIGEPRLMFSYSYGGDKAINSILDFPAVRAADVVDPSVEVYISVKNPDDTYAVSLDGITLNKVRCDVDYSIKLSAFGRYKVSYSGSDSSGNPISFSYNVNCVDEIAPEITLTKTKMSTSVGKQVKIPKFDYKDNFSVKENIKIYTQVVAPNGVISSFKDSFVAEMKGSYKIKVIAVDESGNVAIKEIVLSVR